MGDAADFVKYADPVYPDTDDPTLGDGRNWVMAHVAFPAIRDVIDSGNPCPIGVVIGHLPNVTGIGHQVCVYAYQLSGRNLVLWVYDPNSPGNDDITMQLDISRTDQALINVHSTVNVPHAPICFFTQAYEQRSPVQGRRIEFYSVRQFLASRCVKGPSLRTAIGHGGSLRQIMGV